MNSSKRLPEADLDHVMAHTRPVWDALRDARILITGGTGFFGHWLVESFCRAVDELNLTASAVVVTRFPERFPFAHPAVSPLKGDITHFAAQGPFTHVIHAATVNHDVKDPPVVWDSIVGGMRHVLDVARNSGATRLLFTSSGAIYGRQPADLTHVPEFYPGAPDPLDKRAAYAHAKRAAEYLCTISGLDCVIARGFAFIGPHLPLDVDFAAGNFIRDALAGGPIVVGGDGTPYRSYLYAADLAIWLWTLLVRGQPGVAYNVGSESAVTIRELAEHVTQLSPGLKMEVLKPAGGGPALRYVPLTRRARTELGLEQWVTLPDGIRRMFDFARDTR